MNGRNKSLARIIIVAVVVLGAALVISFISNRLAATERWVVDTIASRLRQDNIPYRSVRVTSSLPLAVEVVITSTGTRDKPRMDDAWNTLIAKREVLFSHVTTGMHVEQLKLVVLGQDGAEYSTSSAT